MDDDAHMYIYIYSFVKVDGSESSGLTNKGRDALNSNFNK
jgi:hypothetical protein